MGASGGLPAAARVAHSSPAIWDVPCRAKCPALPAPAWPTHLAGLADHKPVRPRDRDPSQSCRAVTCPRPVPTTVATWKGDNRKCPCSNCLARAVARGLYRLLERKVAAWAA
jgi:hypothetical protein